MKLFLPLFFIALFSLNAQSNWQALPNAFSNPNGQRFDDVFFLNENIGWAANGFYAAIYKTTDGGMSWTEQLNENDLGGSYYFRNIEFLNEDIGFVGTLNNQFFKTIDGGANWAEVVDISPNPNAICGLDAVGNSTVYGCGAYFEPAHIIKSEDSGETWTYIDMSSYADALVEIQFLDEMNGFVSGNNENGGTVLKTTDGGLSWTEIYNSNVAGEFVWKLQTLDGNNDVIFGSIQPVAPNPGKLIKSIDGGITWSSFDAPETGIQALGFITADHGWLGGYGAGFYETTDGGQTWNTINNGGNLNRIFILSETLAYASGTTLYKFTDETLTNQTFGPTKSKPSLSVDIVENPIEEKLRLIIDFKSADNLVIGLYDANGQFVKQLARSIILDATIEEFQFDVSDLATGIYYLDIHNNDNRFTKKFIKE
ncbi:MAG: YCF48-related protein [Bacteroidota bacterium]